MERGGKKNTRSTVHIPLPGWGQDSKIKTQEEIQGLSVCLETHDKAQTVIFFLSLISSEVYQSTINPDSSGLHKQ